MDQLSSYRHQWLKLFGEPAPEHLTAQDLAVILEDQDITPEELTQEFKILPEDELEILKLFRIFDTDSRDGLLDPQEFKRAFEQLGLSAKDKFIAECLTKLDASNEWMNFEEFYFMVARRQPDPTKYDPAAITAG